MFKINAKPRVDRSIYHNKYVSAYDRLYVFEYQGAGNYHAYEVTDNGDGTKTLELASSSVDFDHIVRNTQQGSWLIVKEPT